jgi:hypothetical protein
MKLLVVAALLALSLVAACGQGKQETRVETEIRTRTTTVEPGPAAEIK